MPLSPITEKPARTAAWGYALIVSLTLLAYLPTLHNGFVWDDDATLTDNPLIKLSNGLHYFWLTSVPDDYWPVPSTTLWAEWRLWGMHAAGYHATNLLLHLVESVLLWRILRQLKIPGALLGALLFAVHPVNVESVAWIAQRKNLMAMLFYLLSIYWFVRWLEVGRITCRGVAQRRRVPNPPGMPASTDGPAFVETSARQGERRVRDNPPYLYGLSLLAFLLAMLSKGSVAMLPLVLAGIIAWRRPLTLKDGIRLAPFFAVAGGLLVVNVWFRTHGLDEAARTAGPLDRLLGAAAVPWFYLGKELLPFHLTFVYPQWYIHAQDWRWWLPLLGTIAATGLSLGRVILNPPGLNANADGAKGGLGIIRPTWARACLFAWLYFCVMLVPVMGFTDVGFMKYSLVADHYQHLALIGMAALAGAGWSHWARRQATMPLLVAIGVVGLLVVLTWRQCGIYRDSPTLYQETLQRNPRCWLAYNNLGNLMLDAGKPRDALPYFEKALQANPRYAEAENNLGTTLSHLGRASEAMVHYKNALRLNPSYASAEYDLGTLLLKAGKTEAALPHFERALQIRPAYPEAHNNLGAALARLGRGPEAVVQYEAALRFRPDFAEADYNLGLSLRDAGRAEEARSRFEEAVRLQPGYIDALEALGLSLYNTGKAQESIAYYERALRLRPDFPEALNNSGCALLKLGRVQEAILRFAQALRLDPELPDLSYNFGVALARAGRFDAAVVQFTQAVQLKPDDADTRLKLAAVLWQTGRRDEAVVQRNEALRLQTVHP